MLIILMSALCASYKKNVEGFFEIGTTRMPNEGQIDGTPGISNVELSNIMSGIYSIVKANEIWLTGLYNEMKNNGDIDCSNVNLSNSLYDCNSLDIVDCSNILIMTDCPEKIADQSAEITWITNGSLQENISKVIPYIMKHDQILSIYNTNGNIEYNPSTDLNSIVNGTNVSIEKLKNELELLIRYIPPSGDTEYVECDEDVLNASIQKLQDALKNPDYSYAKNALDREIGKLKFRIVKLKDDSLKHTVKCNTNLPNTLPIIDENTADNKINLLTMYYLFSILKYQDTAMRNLELNISDTLRQVLNFPISETDKLIDRVTSI